MLTSFNVIIKDFWIRAIPKFHRLIKMRFLTITKFLVRFLSILFTQNFDYLKGWYYWRVQILAFLQIHEISGFELFVAK